MNSSYNLAKLQKSLKTQNKITKNITKSTENNKNLNKNTINV